MVMVEYSLEGAKWSNPVITWSLAESTYPSDQANPFSSFVAPSLQDAVLCAFRQWASVAPISFEQVPDSSSISSSADIRIGFATLNTPSTGVIGQTTITWLNATGALVPDEIVRLEDPSQLALVPSSDGNLTYAGTSATLRQVALHEIGHALGLGHATDPNAVMYASVGSNNQTLDSTDVAGIHSLYGTPLAAPSLVSSVISDVLTVHLSEDAWQGDAQFVVSVDGQQLGAPRDITALHALGQDQSFRFQGNLGVGPHDVGITFLNDAWGGGPDTDRNLYVNGLDYDGSAVPQSSAALFSAGTAYFQVNSAAANAMLMTDVDKTIIGSLFPLS